MKLSATNQTKIKQLLSIADPAIDWMDRDTANIVNLQMEVNPKDISKLIQSDAWPKAISPALIVQDEKQKQTRAHAIINGFVRDDLADKKFLDFGCGEGHCVAVAKSQKAVAIGFDPNQSDNWDKSLDLTTDWQVIAKQKPYDVILCYDVFDHITNESDRSQAIWRLNDVLSDTGKIYVRFHPYSSRHGTHLYRTINKAYAHLFLNRKQIKRLGGKPDAVHRTLRPKVAYRRLLSKSGLKIQQEEFVIQDPEEIIVMMVKHIAHNWRKLNEKSILKVISKQFADYVLVKDS